MFCELTSGEGFRRCAVVPECDRGDACGAWPPAHVEVQSARHQCRHVGMSMRSLLIDQSISHKIVEGDQHVAASPVAGGAGVGRGEARSRWRGRRGSDGQAAVSMVGAGRGQAVDDTEAAAAVVPSTKNRKLNTMRSKSNPVNTEISVTCEDSRDSQPLVVLGSWVAGGGAPRHRRAKRRRVEGGA